MISRLLHSLRFAFLRFLVVGGINTLFGYAVYAILVLIGLGPHPALILAFGIGVIWNYFTYARLVFGTRGLRRLPPYVLAYVALYGVNATGLEVLLAAGVSPMIAQGILVLPAAALAFLIIGRVLTGRFPWQPAPEPVAAPPQSVPAGK